MGPQGVHLLGLLVAVAALQACSNDGSPPGGGDCPPGTVAGTQLGCTCEDGDDGVRVCDQNLTLTSCDCSTDERPHDGGLAADDSAGDDGPGDGDGDGDPGDGDGDGDAPPPGDGDGDAPPGDGDGDTDPPDQAPVDAGPEEPTDAGRVDAGDAGEQTFFAACSSVDGCPDGLQCARMGGGSGRPGYCTARCQGDAQCTVDPPTGTIEASCLPIGAAAMGTTVCALDCSETPGGCPDGMECVQNASLQRCVYGITP